MAFLSSGQCRAEDMPQPAAQQETRSGAPSTDFSPLKRTASGRVGQVLDGLTILLKDGTLIRLSAMDIPAFVYPEPGEISLQAKKALKDLLPPGTEILIYQTIKPKTGRENRMGQRLAHVETKKDNVWAQGYLLERGLARVAPTPTNPEMTDAMLAAENAARTQKKGLWADDSYPLLTPETAGQADGSFAVVEGTILNAASVRNTLYLNFGKNWREDFTIMIEPAVRKLLVRAGIDPLALNGRRVRVRGWVRTYNGPLIDLNHPSALEVLEKTTPPLKDSQAAPILPSSY